MHMHMLRYAVTQACAQACWLLTGPNLIHNSINGQSETVREQTCTNLSWCTNRLYYINGQGRGAQYNPLETSQKQITLVGRPVLACILKIGTSIVRTCHNVSVGGCSRYFGQNTMVFVLCELWLQLAPHFAGYSG